MFKVSITTVFIFAAIMVFAHFQAHNAHVALDKRGDEISQAWEDVQSLTWEADDLDDAVSNLEAERVKVLEEREELLNEIDIMQADIPYSSVPEINKIAIKHRKRLVSLIPEAISEIDSKLVIAKQKQTEGVPPLRAKAAKIGVDEDLRGPYKDAEENKYEGRMEFWGLLFVCMVLTLSLVCPTFRYVMYFATGLALLNWVTHK